MDLDELSPVYLTALSPFPSKPCLLLTLPSCKILFDTAVDFSPMDFYKPASMIPKVGMDLTDYVPNENVHVSDSFGPSSKRARYSSEAAAAAASNSNHDRKNDNIDVKPSVSSVEAKPNVSIDAVPQVNFAFNSNIDLTVIDAVFISNWESLKALPFLIKNHELTCPIYATEPIMSLGSLLIEDLIHFFERTDKSLDKKAWVDANQWDSYVGEDARRSIPAQWQDIYTKECLKTAMSRMTRISPNQPVQVGNTVTVKLYQSGFDIGSSNWLVEAAGKKIGYWAATSKNQRYVHEPVFGPYKKLDSLIVTSLREFDSDPNDMIADLCATAVDTLCAGGNVLIPMQPIGMIYDIIESLIGRMEQVAPNANYPVYVFSPVASRGLAVTGIAGEWFSADRRENLFKPKPPFKIEEFIERKRVKFYDSIHSDFAREYMIPCVVFAGHQSLRIGDAVYFLELWSNNSKNAVLLSDPDYDFESTWAPFKTMRMRAYWFPIDMRLSASELNTIIESNVKCEKLIVPEDYVNGNQGVLKHKKIMTFEPSLPLEIAQVDDRIEFICFSDSVSKQVQQNGAVISGFLNHMGNQIFFSDKKESEETAVNLFKKSK